MSEITQWLVPLVLGSISIVAWLSVRNESVSSRIRKTVDELLDESKPLTDLRRSSLQSQLLLFIPRYEQNTRAMCCAICAIFAVGGIVAVLVWPTTNTFDVKASLIFGFVALGACLMIYSIFISIREIRSGRTTLYHHVAACLEAAPVALSHEHQKLLERVLKVIERRGISEQTVQRIRDATKALSDPKGELGADGRCS